MTRNLLIGWLYLPLWMRILHLLLSGTLVLTALWLGGMRPVLHQADELSATQRQHSARNQAMLRRLLRQPPLLLLESELVQLQQALLSVKRPAFSLDGLISSSGGTLEAWRPDNQGGELKMRLRWSEFQAVLQYLRSLSAGVMLTGFMLREQEGLLSVKLSLVLNDDF
ncbi:hypothetical protein ABW286_17835 [Erwinia papayae]|uniref:DNA utilization protein HofO C-terminal domain-containing protein n=1 Tax=Erwinia papayae TaxID=206499 RepID=A0ABV3N5I5_9GAMM